MRIIKLPLIFKPTQNFPLIRVGSPRDGGYLIDERLISCDLVSLGISGDWEFERQWKNNNQRVNIETYDGSISFIKFAVTAILSLCRLHKPTLIQRNILTTIEYVTFLTSQTKLRRLFVGKRDQKNWISYEQLVNNTDCRAPFFLKIDIEGHEYEILAEILEQQHLLSGIAIEFHRPLTNLKTIEEFITTLDLSLCNIHPNNCLPKLDSCAEPSIEMTFSRYEGIAGDPQIPNTFETDNDETCQTIRIQFPLQDSTP